MAGQEYGTANLGGNFSLPYLTDWLRYVAQPLSRFRQVCDVKEALGTGAGNTFQFDIIANIATQGTTLAETATIPASNFTITKGSCTVYEFGNSIPYTRILKLLAQHSIEDVVRKTLANDMPKCYDQYIWDNCIKTTPLIFQASDGTDTANVELLEDGTGDAALAATCWMHTGHVMQIVDTLKERNVPAFDGEDYVCIGHPTTFASLKNQLVSVNQYTESGYKKILNGEIGRFGGMRFVEQTQIAKVTPTNAGAGSWAAIFGAEAVIEAVSLPDEVIEKEVTDYGRSRGLAWYGVTGFTPAFPHDYTGSSHATANVRIALWWPNATSPTA